MTIPRRSSTRLSPQQRRSDVAELMDQQAPITAPLSFAQQRLWILDRFQPGNPAYNIPTAIPLQGWLNIRALERSLNEIVRRHETLRTRFEVIDGKPAQVIDPPLEIPLEIMDLRSVAPAAVEAEVGRIIFEEGRRSFDLAKGPLFRALLLKINAMSNVLILVMHHIVSDGWSMSVLNRELSTLYMAYLRGQQSPFPELPIQYADFARWQSEWFRGEVIEEQLGYWRKQLTGLRPVLDLPTDRPRPPVQTNNGALIGFILDHRLCEDLKSLSQSRNATLFMTLLAAFKTLLHRLSGETDIAVGSPIANRTRSELEGLIGFFVNTLVLRTDLSGDPTFIELLAREREMALGAFGHQDMPFEKLVEELQPERDLSHNPLFQILFAVQNIGTVDRNAPQQQPPSSGPPLGNGTAKFDLTLSLLDTGGGAQGFLEYNADLFDTSTAEMIVERYQTLLRGVVEEPTQRVSQLPIFTTREREEPPAGLAGPKIDSSMRETVSEVLYAQAAANPQAVAVVGPGGEISYLELERRTDRIASHLLSRGANKESFIAVAMSRDLENVLAVLSVLKAGCSYIPIDSSELVLSKIGGETLPPRVSRILAQAKPMMILVDEVTRSSFPSDVSGVVLLSQLESEAQSEDRKPDVSVTPESVAAVVYQFGPVDTLHSFPLTHRALCRIAIEPRISLKASDRVAYVSYAASDSSRFEIFGTLAAGATIVCLLNEALSAPRRFANALRESGVTVLFARAATIEHLAREFPWALRNIRLLLLDERITDSQRLLEVLKPELRERIFSLYGDVAAGGFFAVQPLSSLLPDARTIPLGSPTPGVTLYALDKNLELVPAGVVGEIYLESETLAVNGSNGDDSLIASPFTSSTKTQLYRTGDIARQLLDGSLEYRGRRDGRILSRTAYVYPAEIESVLVQHPVVQDAAVAPRMRDRGLAALLETEADKQIESELGDFLAANLPAHLIPTAFVIVKTLPRLVDGQIDRQAVAEAIANIDAPKPASEPYVEPRNDIETALAQIWMETLGTDRIGIKDNFFRLGGHSLLATQAVARISDAFNIDLQLQRLFESPTVEQLAQVIEPLARSDFKPEIMSIKRVPRDQPQPLSFAQQRLWFLDQFEPDSAFYNIAIPLRWQGPVDANALEAAFNDLIVRHETLRTTFTIVDAEPVQVIASSYQLSLVVHDLKSLPAEERVTRAQTLAAIEAQRPFNLKSGPVLRAELVKIDEADHLLLFTIHHIAADGWSTEVLFRELFQFYEARRNGRVADLPELGVQYADFACWQRKRLSGALLDKQLAYWKRQLQDAPALLELPTDRPRPRVQMFRGAMHMFSMPALILESVKEIAQQEQTTLFTVLLAALNVLLYRYTGREDLVVGSPIANRTRPELESLIGFFANTLVLRTQVSGKMTFRELVSRVTEVTLGAYAHQDIPFEKLVEEFQPERNLAYNPLFQIMFALQNTGRPLVSASSSPDDSIPVVGAGVAKFDLTLFVSETTSGLKAGIEYNSDLFDTSTIARFASHYEALLRSIINDADRQIWTLPMLTAEESDALVDWNDTAVPFKRECVQRMFEAQVERTPDATAIIFNDAAITYRDLNSRANFLAHRLIELGIGPNLAVGISMERTPEMIVAVIATLKAGGAYVPIDPNYPPERIALMLSDSRAPILLTETHLRAKLPSTNANVLTMEDLEPGGKREDNPSGTVTAGDLAYIIYTSGSTGDPKGVAMPHVSLTNLLQWQIPRSNLPPNARTLQFASLSFDVSFQEIFSTLCSGGSLVIVTEDQRRDPAALWNLLSKEKVNRLFLPYVALQQLAEHAKKKIAELPSSLTEVITAGEQLQITPQIAAMFERLNASLFNQYGPTESHVVTELKLTGTPREWPTRPPIGKPIQNATIHILDEFGQPCAIGTPGELHIGGEVLARGYLGREDLTAESFIAASQPAGDRLYRTGDRARYLADGNIQFLGRMDDQVKIRGFRVEPGEIEAALRKHPLVGEAVVIAHAHAAEEFRLAAYVQADPHHRPSVQELRRHLASLLPEYMIPSSFAVMSSLPLTPSGKLNRRALPGPDSPAAELPPAIAARTPVEEVFTRIWREILELPRVGVRDNFFELGGHSLLATRVISRIRDEFNVDLPVRRMFETPTIEALALSVVEATLEAQSLDETAQLLAEIEQMSDEEARLS